jgi:hypothetical protein
VESGRKNSDSFDILFLDEIKKYVLLSSLIYFKFALMVFDKKLQRFLDEGNHVVSKDLIVIATNQFLFSN